MNLVDKVLKVAAQTGKVLIVYGHLICLRGERGDNTLPSSCCLDVR